MDSVSISNNKALQVEMTLPKATIKNRHEMASERLREKTKQLVSNFLKGAEPSFLEQHAQILDDYFIESFEASKVGLRLTTDKNPFAIIALGGYGREEQCIHSDVDLLFLFDKRIPEAAEDLIREIIYPLWDIGLDVGYATRAIKDCVHLAGKEIEVLTSLLDARFICGMSLLYSKLMDQLRNRLMQKKSKQMVRRIVEENHQRHIYFGDSAYLLEPNLKEGQGGLRDFHTLLWLARIRSNIKQFRDLEYHGYFSHDEFERLSEALRFIRNVRNCLHYLTGRKCDQLYFEHQIKMASALNFQKKNGQQPVERFLSELHGHMECLKQQHLMFLYELGYAGDSKRKRKVRKHTRVTGLKITEAGMLNFFTPKKILDAPDLLMKIFEESARLDIPLSAEAKRLVREFVYLVDPEFSSSAVNVKSFEQVLVMPAPTFNVLNEMLNTGFLERFIPEIKAIINRIQYDEYHLYPVDRHSLRTINAIKNFGTAESISKDPLCGDLYKTLKNKKLLLWAALLHDIGKGKPGKSHSRKGAEIVRSVLTRKGYTAETVEAVSFLVQEHLMLIKTATRRDIHDEETAISCARKIKSVNRLKMLYLLTIADSMATGPKAWNDWNAVLLRDLFFKVLSILEKGELATHEAVEMVEKKKAKVIGSATGIEDKQELETLFNFMSPRYIHYIPDDDILEHIELYKRIGTAYFVWKVDRVSESKTRMVTICAKDRPGLISKIAGTFTLNSLDILNVQVFTWRNNIALDIFEVKPPPDQIFEAEKWEKVETQLRIALSGELDLASALSEKVSVSRSARRPKGERPHRVVVDNNSSSFFTIIEVFAYDFPGLLYRITDALFRCRLDIWVAKIATKADQVVDVFYVRDFDGQKVDAPGQVEAIQSVIEAVLPKAVYK